MEEKKIPPQEEQDAPAPYTPASPVKRTMAWIGVVYMVILVAMMTYYYFTGSMLVNMAPLLAVPGLIGLGILALVSWAHHRPPRQMARHRPGCGVLPGGAGHPPPGHRGPAVQFQPGGRLRHRGALIFGGTSHA